MRVEKGRNRRERERARDENIQKEAEDTEKKARGSIDEVERRGLTEHEHE